MRDALQMGLFLLALLAAVAGMVATTMSGIGQSQDEIAEMYRQRYEKSKTAAVGLPLSVPTKADKDKAEDK